MGRTAASALYKSEPTWATVLTGIGYTAYTSTTSNRIAWSRTAYDDIGRVYWDARYAIDLDSDQGNSLGYLTTNYYHDLNGRLVATAPYDTAATEYAYDGAGRRYQTRNVLQLESTKYIDGEFQYRNPVPDPEFDSGTAWSSPGDDDQTIALTHQVFDASSNVIETHSFEANPNDTDGIDLQANNDYVRRSVYRWYDDADRLTHVADYGSGDTDTGAGTWKWAAVPSRPSSAPTTDDEKLVTEYAYAFTYATSTTGRNTTVTDPEDIDTKTFYDALGRTTALSEKTAIGRFGAQN